MVEVVSGFKVGELTVVQRVGSRRSGSINLRKQVRVECSCGTRLTIPSYYLTREFPKQHCGGPAHASDKTRHNEVYRIWVMMRRRCNNPTHVSYKYYGAIGIKVCEAWDNDKDGFANFLAYIGARPGPEYSIDRWPNPAGNYEPGNVRWATDEQQANNKRPKLFPAAPEAPGSEVPNT
jgi:hypothetical protein